MTALTDKEQLRYTRHLLLDKIGEAGQVKLKQAHVVIVGAGGLGSPASLYLAAAGVGQLTIIDPDQVDVTNLQRQILFKTNHVKRDKAILAQQQLTALNPEIVVNALVKPVQKANLAVLLDRADVVLDCTDNAESRYFVNQACQRAKVALISGAAIRGEGQLLVFDFKASSSPCYQCVYPELSEQTLNCSTAGVIGPLLGVIGSMQALQAIKYLLGEAVQKDRLFIFDAWSLDWRSFTLSKDKNCKCCCLSA